jgi:ribA/ribD-fused uncharacterized protein
MITEFRDEYRFLSNFYPLEFPIKIEGLEFWTIENIYQAAKSLDYAHWKLVSAATPGEAKRLGAKADLREDWDEYKYGLMSYLTHLKFMQPTLKKKLKLTGNEYIVEGNSWHDNYWGSCFCVKCEKIEGQNNLGKILMTERYRLE